VATSDLAGKSRSLPLSQRQRPKPSKVKAKKPRRRSPGDNLRLAMEISDFCLALRDAVRYRHR
jgi:hypothetical protein